MLPVLEVDLYMTHQVVTAINEQHVPPVIAKLPVLRTYNSAGCQEKEMRVLTG